METKQKKSFNEFQETHNIFLRKNYVIFKKKEKKKRIKELKCRK